MLPSLLKLLVKLLPPRQRPPRRLLSVAGDSVGRSKGFVTVFEVGPRDGLQNEKVQVPLAAKIRLVDMLSDCGLTRIEAASFVSPKWVPQMADGAGVLRGISRRRGVTYVGLTPNLKGLEAALEAGVDEVALFASASEQFSRRNTNCTIAESLDRFRPVLEAASRAKLQVRCYLSCVLGCPYEGPVSSDAVTRVTLELLALGIYQVSLSDTIGVGTPDGTCRLLECLLSHRSLTPHLLGAHYHNTNGMALKNIEATLGFGIRTVDSSVAGLGGCPFAGPGASGNVSTESVVSLLHSLGYETGVDPGKLQLAGDFIRGVLARLKAAAAAAAEKTAS